MSDQATEQSQNPMDRLMDAINPGQSAEADPEPQSPEPGDDDTAQPAQAETPAEPQKFRVRMKGDAGEDVEQDLTFEELQSGYQRHADYTRKTQELAKQRDQFNAHAQQVFGQELARQQGELQRLQAVVWQTMAPELQNVDWQRLATEDPAEWARMQAKAQTLQSTLGAIDQRLNQISSAQKQQLDEYRQRVMRESADDLKRNGFTAEKYQQTLTRGLEYGFSEQELRGVVDARIIRVLADAAKYRDLQTKTPEKKVSDAPPVMKPGAVGNRNDDARTKAKAKLRQSGSVRDLAAAMAAMNL